jgi:hypothetical protein
MFDSHQNLVALLVFEDLRVLLQQLWQITCESILLSTILITLNREVQFLELYYRWNGILVGISFTILGGGKE